LVRAAYGRTNSPDDEERAAEARRALQRLDLRKDAERQALERAAPDAEDARERRARRIRSRTVRVVGTLVALAVIAAGTATWLRPPVPRDDPPSADTMELGHREVAPLPTRVPVRAVTTGSSASAERWFDVPQSEADVVDASLPPHIDPSTTRLVSTDMPGWKVWVAKDDDAGLCLVVHESGTTEAVSECATPEDFTASGVLVSSVGSTSIRAFWDGFDVRTGQNGTSIAPD
jgi:hypothetical protein